MIEPGKLNTLSPSQKRRKLALTFGALERDILGTAERGSEYAFQKLPRAEYAKALVRLVLRDPALNRQTAAHLSTLLESQPLDELRLCNTARHALLAIMGTFPAEWDLVIAPHSQNQSSQAADLQRDYFKKVFVYAEDIRSPFNLGSIIRTAEALGAERIFISPQCVSPEHPKAIRSAMGCEKYISCERKSLEELTDFANKNNLPIFVLETGGSSITDFTFPQEGICVIGSEELGVSPEALKASSYGIVTIPMKGIKAALNVGVAFGILMQAWTQSITQPKEPRAPSN